jgi:cytochrome P450
VAQTAAIVQDPVGFFTRNEQRYGEVFRARLVGVPRIVYVTTPPLADRVLRTDRDIGEAGTARKDFLEPLVGAESVLCLEGEPWLRERRRLAPAFRHERMRAWEEEITAVAAAEVATWPVNEPFALRPRLQRITLEVILRVVFGLNGTGQGADEEARGRLRAMLTQLLEVASTPALAFLPRRLGDWLAMADVAQRLPRNLVARFIRLKAATDDVLIDRIRTARAGSAGDRRDLLSILATVPEATESQIRDELITMLEAGHETTATGLSWLFERLLRLPAVRDTVRSAVMAGDGGYLDAVVKESLRLRPVVMDAPRALTSPMVLDGYAVPSGWYVAPVIPLVHTDATTYDDPHAFRPERFLGQHPPAGAWIPFGGSRRMCLGFHLALLEMRVVLSEVLRRVTLNAVDPAPERARLRGVTIVPQHRTRVVVTARLTG